MYVGLYGTAIFIFYFIKGKPTVVFMRILSTDGQSLNMHTVEQVPAASGRTFWECCWPCIPGQ